MCFNCLFLKVLIFLSSITLLINQFTCCFDAITPNYSRQYNHSCKLKPHSIISWNLIFLAEVVWKMNEKNGNLLLQTQNKVWKSIEAEKAPAELNELLSAAKYFKILPFNKEICMLKIIRRIPFFFLILSWWCLFWIKFWITL